MCEYKNRKNHLNVQDLYYKTVNKKFGYLSYFLGPVTTPMSTIYFLIIFKEYLFIHNFNVLLFIYFTPSLPFNACIIIRESSVKLKHQFPGQASKFLPQRKL